jgi:hypothetical protein
LILRTASPVNRRNVAKGERSRKVKAIAVKPASLAIPSRASRRRQPGRCSRVILRERVMALLIILRVVMQD